MGRTEDLGSDGFVADGGEVARAGETFGWAYAIESFGAALNDEALVERASVGTRLICFRRNVNSASWLTCAVDGRVVCPYDPLHRTTMRLRVSPLPGWSRRRTARGACSRSWKLGGLACRGAWISRISRR
ncbi:DUF6461 domain-containing protein [Streptomyces aureoversilis]|uniref:DUF6461 domain-containing protein n=1 Tax=Streptomyces aureoversilis TaxID=67277 RepID=A0ABV9ZSZ3_9ACTN